MVELLAFSLSVIYLLMARQFFNVWLAAFKEDANVPAQEKSGVPILLVISTVLWPLVVPFAYLELLSRQKAVSDSDSCTVSQMADSSTLQTLSLPSRPSYHFDSRRPQAHENLIFVSWYEVELEP